MIVLPQQAYVQDGMADELNNILQHELTHYRRKDVLYKWFVAAVTSIHWFNPVMLLIRREINRACELSCDEAVISGMSDIEKRSYGNTLLTLFRAPEIIDRHINHNVIRRKNTVKGTAHQYYEL